MRDSPRPHREPSAVKSSFSEGLRCPDDGHLLQVYHQGRVPFAGCRHCDGLWFSRESIHSRFRATLPDDSRPKRKKVVPAASRTCPQCARKLQPENIEGVVIDVCPNCGGVWLDPGEYKAARRRSVRMRLYKDAPFLRPPTSKLRIALDRLIDFVGEKYTEFSELSEPIADDPPLRLTPRRKPRSRPSE